MRTNLSRALSPSGAALLGGGLLSAQAAWLHMRAVVQAYGAICGSGAAPHCPACNLSVVLFAAGAAALALAQGPAPSRQPINSSPSA